MYTRLAEYKAAALLWYNRDADLMAATVSYYALFAVTPLLLLTITLLGIILGPSIIAAELLRWGSVLGPELLTMVEQAVRNLDTLAVGMGVPLFGAIFFSGTIIMMTNTFTSGLHALWGIPHQGVRGWLKKTRNSIIFLLVLQLYLLAVIMVSFATNALDVWLGAFWLAMGKSMFFVVVTTILFSFMYRFLPWQYPPLRARLYGAFVASVLFLISKSLVSLYIGITPVPGLYGAAGLLIVLMIWVYVTTAIIYFGAALAHVMTHQSIVRP